jgi:hypothetical protein
MTYSVAQKSSGSLNASYWSLVAPSRKFNKIVTEFEFLIPINPQIQNLVELAQADREILMKM